MEGCAEAFLNNAVRGGGAAKTPARLELELGGEGALQQLRDGAESSE
jgi:hypothetical protein